MSSSIAYEIQSYRDGRWKIQSFFNDTDLAVMEAKRMAESQRYGVIRVVEERFDPGRDRYLTRTIYRAGRDHLRQAEQTAKSPVAANNSRKLSSAASRQYVRPSSRKAKPSNFADLLGLGVAIVSTGILLIYMLDWWLP